MVLRKISNKRGQSLETSTIILIVLGIALLIILIFGFSTGWGNLWGKIVEYINPQGSNVDTIKQACEIACSQNAVNTWCMNERTLKLSDGKKVIGSCQYFVDGSSISGLSCSSINANTCGQDYANKKIDWAEDTKEANA